MEKINLTYNIIYIKFNSLFIEVYYTTQTPSFSTASIRWI